MNTTRLSAWIFMVGTVLLGALSALGVAAPPVGDESDAGTARVIPTQLPPPVPRARPIRKISGADLGQYMVEPGVSPLVIPRDQMVGPRYRLDRQSFGSGVIGNDEGDTLFNLFLPFEANGDNRFLFLDSRVLVSDGGRGGANLGVGYRRYSERLDRIFSLSGWWDWDNSHHRSYRQMGASFASLGQFFDFRINGYFPNSNERNTLQDVTDMTNPFFGGNNVLVNRTRVFESNYGGFDTEIGGPLPVLGRYGARGYVGLYHWSSDHDQDTTGVKARVETHVTDDVMVGVSYSDDSLFGSNTWLNVVLTLPDGRPEKWFRQQTMKQRLNQSTRRNNRVVINRRRQVDQIALLNASGANSGDPISIVWVDPSASFNGAGTFESPLNSLESYANNPNNDFIIIGSGDLDGQITLFEDQTLVSEWMLNQEQYVLDTTRGFIPMPAVDPDATVPSFSNPVAVDGSQGGTIVTVAGSRTEIGGIDFDGTTNISGVLANAITTASGAGWMIGGFDIHDNDFDNTRNAVVFNNDGDGSLALGVFERNLLRGAGFDSNAGFQLTATNASLLNLRVAENEVSNFRGEDLDGDGVLDPGEDANGNGALDAGVAFSITASDRAVIHAVSIPGDPNDPDDPGTPLGITGNTAVNNGTGLLLLTETDGVINADVQDNVFNNNFDPNTGVSMTADGGTINLLSFRNNDVNDNLGTGMRLFATGGGTIASLANEDRNNNGELDDTEDANGNGLLDVGEDLNGNGVLDGPEDANGNGVADFGFTGNRILGNGGDGLVVVTNDGSISNLNIGSVGDALPDDGVLGNLAEPDANGDTFLNRGNGNGLLDPGEDVNGNGILDPGEDNNEDLNNNGVFDLVTDRRVGAFRSEDVNGDGVLNAGNGNGALDPGEDINENGVLDPGEDANEDVNGNGLLDRPDNVITENGVSLDSTGSGIVLMTMETEDLNGNGQLDVDEDINGNGRLDLGGGVITASIVNNFLDNTFELDGSGNPVLENNTGSQISISANGGSQGTGSITIDTIANNSLTGAGDGDAITIDAAAAGLVTIGRIENNTLDHGSRRGITVTSDTATVDLGTVDNNTINRLLSGTESVRMIAVDSALSGVFTRNRMLGDSTTNLLTGIGMAVESSGGNLALEVGQDDPLSPGALTFGNTITGSTGAGVLVLLQDNGTGTVSIRQNTILSTLDDLDAATPAGEAIHVALVSKNLVSGDANAVLSGSIIDGNIIGDELDVTLVNASHGIVVRATEDTEIRDLFISNNTVAGNLGDGIRFDRNDDARVAVVNPQTGQVRGVTIEGNTILANLGVGLGISATNGGATQVAVEARDNEITANASHGIHALVANDADLVVDLTENLVDANLGDGVLLEESYNVFETALRQMGGTWSRNTISNNLGSGATNSAHSVGLVIGLEGVDPVDGSSLGNTITDNGLDGVELNGFGDAIIANNIISGNGVLAVGSATQDGTGIDINWVDPAEPFTFVGKQYIVRANTVEDNRGDGIEIQQGGVALGSTSLEMVAEANEVRLNDGRGVDILNQDSGESFIRFGDGSTANRNQIDNNGLEGFYVVNTASAVQNQTDLADVDLDATGAVTATPNLVLMLDDNSIESNNQSGTFIAGGLVLRVGTSNSPILFTGADETGSNDFDGNGVGTNATLNTLGQTIGNGRVNARIVDNVFADNVGNDVYIESFTSTVDPVETEDEWDDTEFTVTVFEGDPLARLNLVMSGNTGGSLQVTNGESDRSATTGFSNVVGAFYNNDEDLFKSRLDSQTPPGPFSAEDRRRNAQRIAARDGLPPTGGPDGGVFEYPGMGISTFRIETGFDLVDSNGSGTGIFAAGRGFILDDLTPNGIDFTLPLTFGELPFGWREEASGTFDFSFPNLP